MKEDIEKIMNSFRKITMGIISREKRPSDYGTGEFLYRFETHVIDAIGMNPGININGIADMMNVTKGAISQVVNKLVIKKYINKVKDPANRRRIMLSLTQKGKTVFSNHRAFHNKINEGVAEILGDLSKDQREAVLDVFQKLNKAFEDR
jgi:DNA-binding MarR family transcriptional regulator